MASSRSGSRVEATASEGSGWTVARRAVLLVGLAVPAALAIGCSGAAGEPAQPTCSGALALTAEPLAGASLGDKQIALTFDDGPGTRTSELSTFLNSQGVRAAFFVNGKNIADGPEGTAILAQLVADGHVVANHTQNHASLINDFANTAAGNASRVDELSQTDAIIAPFVPNGRFLFRAPFGDWNDSVYAALHASAMDKYVGHIHWDIGDTRTATTAADWACWQEAPQITSKACADLYGLEIASVGKGIVLMHDADYGDSANTNPNAGIGNTVDMVKVMVPALKAAGYTFVRVDEVPAIAALLPPLADAEAAKPADAKAGEPQAAAGAAAPPAGPSTPAADPCAPVKTATAPAGHRHEHAH